MDCPVCGQHADENVKICCRCGTKFSFLESEKDCLSKVSELVEDRHKQI